MNTGISEQDAQALGKALYEAERKIRSQMRTIKALRNEVDGYDSLAADRARLEKAISDINDLAVKANGRDTEARIRAIKEIATSA